MTRESGLRIKPGQGFNIERLDWGDYASSGVRLGRTRAPEFGRQTEAPCGLNADLLRFADQLAIHVAGVIVSFFRLCQFGRLDAWRFLCPALIHRVQTPLRALA